MAVFPVLNQEEWSVVACERKCWSQADEHNHQSCHTTHSIRSSSRSNHQYSKNPYTLRNRIISNLATVGAQEPWGHRPSGSWRPGSCWIGTHVISQRVWVLAFIPWPIGIRITGNRGIAQFPKPLFSTDFDSGHGIIGTSNILSNRCTPFPIWL